MGRMTRASMSINQERTYCTYIPGIRSIPVNAHVDKQAEAPRPDSPRPGPPLSRVVFCVFVQVYGVSAGGDADELRLLSTNDTYVNLRAHGGNLDFLSTKVQQAVHIAQGIYRSATIIIPFSCHLTKCAALILTIPSTLQA